MVAGLSRPAEADALTVSTRVVISVLVTIGVLTVLNFWFYSRRDTMAESPTSLGRGAHGYGALYDLLDELDLEVERSYLRPEKLRGDAVVWFVAPHRQRGGLRGGKAVLEDLRPWVERGGTAVVFGGEHFNWSPVALELAESSEDFAAVIPGAQLPERSVELDEPRVFSVGDLSDGDVSDESGLPFVVELSLGSGKLVAVADHRFLLNARLDAADNSIFAVDLVRAYGVPRVDERFHGLRETRSLLDVVGVGRLWLLVLSLCLLSLVAVWSRQRWPARMLQEPEVIEASLRSFVEALAGHYHRVREHGAVFQAYREGFLHRLRRQRGRDERMSDREFENRMRRDPALDAEVARWLLDGELPTKRGEMVQAVRVLERFAEMRG